MFVIYIALLAIYMYCSPYEINSFFVFSLFAHGVRIDLMQIIFDMFVRSVEDGPRPSLTYDEVNKTSSSSSSVRHYYISVYGRLFTCNHYG